MGRKYIWVVGVVFLLGVVLWGFGDWQNRQRMANALESNYQRDFYTVLNQVGQLEGLLSKGLVSSSPRQQVFFLTEVWGRANTAQTTLGQLPFKELNLAKSRKFLAQLGDYAYVMAKRIASGDQLNDQQREQLHSFYNEIKEYGLALQQAERDLHEKSYRWSQALNKPVFKRIGSQDNIQEGKEFNSIEEMEQRFDGLPTLIYDGPFSDGEGEEGAKGLKDFEKKINQKEGEEIAENFINQGGEGHYKAIRTVEVNANGKLPVFGVTLDGRGRPGLVAVDVSIQGGKVLSFLNSRSIGEKRIDKGLAEEKAKTFLKERGFENLEKTFTSTENRSHLIVFAAKDKNIRLYPDQIKVQVALDDGEIIAFDGMMYYQNHHQRELPEPVLSRKEAMEKLSPELTIKSSRLALIPLSGNKEVLTYEFLAEYQGEDYLIYINTQTGEEENILKLVLAPEGELVI